MDGTHIIAVPLHRGFPDGRAGAHRLTSSCVGRLFKAAFILVTLAAGSACFGANVSPAKWMSWGVPGPDCMTPRTVEGFATCREAAAYADQAYLACVPPTTVRIFDPNTVCAGAGANYVYLFYIHHLGSPHVGGIAKSYCDDWNNDTRGNLNVTAAFNPTHGVHCPATNYSMARNMGRPGYCPDCMQGNPVNPAVGNKYQVETDYVAQGPFPLVFARHYNSRLGADRAGLLGPGWGHTYTRKLVYDATLASPFIVGARREDGKEIPFNQVGGVYVRDPTFIERLERVSAGWKLTNAQDEVEVYDSSGRLISITNRVGLVQSLGYDAQGRLNSVTDPFGRSLLFTFDSGSRIQSMTVPGGLEYQYTYTANSHGNLFRVTHPDATTRTYHYENASFPTHLTGITDENGQRHSSYGYTNVEGYGFATSTQRAGGAGRVTLAFTGRLDSEPRNVTVTRHVSSSLSASRTYTFQSVEGSARNTGITGPACEECGPASRTYDGSGNVLTKSDWRGFRTRYDSYDLARNLETQRTEGLASDGSPIFNETRTISTQWHPDFRLPTGIAEPLRITTLAYGGPADPNSGNRGSVLSRTVQATSDASGNSGFSATAIGTPRTWTHTYNGNGQALSVDGPRTDSPDVTTFTYFANDAPCPGASPFGCRGQIETVTNALGHVTRVTEYNAHGQPLAMTDPNGLATFLSYDLRQRLTSRSVGGETTDYRYDNAGQLTRVTLPDGSSLEYTYDAAHRLVQITDSLGNRIVYTLDQAGNRTKEEVFDPANLLAQTRLRVFNSLNRLAQEIGAAGQTTTYGNDNQGNVVSTDGPLPGNVDVTTNGYDALNRLIRVTDPHSGQVNYGYNGLDQLTSVSDPRNLVTSYSYDGLSNLNQQVSPDTGTTSNTYDVAGNLLTQTDAKGQVTQYAYDALNRVTNIAFHDDSRQAYAYDQGVNGLGRLTTITESDSASQVTGAIQYRYDAHGRVESETCFVNGVPYTTGYGYDGAGRLSEMRYPSGRILAYTHDALGRVSQISTTVNDQAQVVVQNVQYRPFGGVGAFTLGNGQTYVRGHDLDGRIANYTLGAQTFAVGYDAASRITSLGDLGNSANTNTYGYDHLDRLTSALTPGVAFAYSYDAVGNRLTKSAGLSSELYSYGGTSNRLSSVAPNSGPLRSYPHDANGSVTSDGMNSYAYDTRGRLIQASSVIGATTYQVNALGQRVRKTSALGDTVFHYDVQGRLIAESTPGGQVRKEYLYLGDIPVAVIQ